MQMYLYDVYMMLLYQDEEFCHKLHRSSIAKCDEQTWRADQDELGILHFTTKRMFNNALKRCIAERGLNEQESELLTSTIPVKVRKDATQIKFTDMTQDQYILVMKLLNVVAHGLVILERDVPLYNIYQFLKAASITNLDRSGLYTKNMPPAIAEGQLKLNILADIYLDEFIKERGFTDSEAVVLKSTVRDGLVIEGKGCLKLDANKFSDVQFNLIRKLIKPKETNNRVISLLHFIMHVCSHRDLGTPVRDEIYKTCLVGLNGDLETLDHYFHVTSMHLRNAWHIALQLVLTKEELGALFSDHLSVKLYPKGDSPAGIVIEFDISKLTDIQYDLLVRYYHEYWKV